MKSIALIALVSLSFSALAQTPAPSSQATVAEIHWVPICNSSNPSCNSEEHTSKIVSSTSLQVSRHDNNDYVLKATSGTVWQGDVQLESVQQVIMTYEGFNEGNSGNENKAGSDNDKNSASLNYKVTVIQVDGNGMGATKTTVNVTCQTVRNVLYCNGSLGEGSWLTLNLNL